MKYTVGKHEFTSSKEYEAAKRDVAKIRGMLRKGNTPPEIALNYLRQIQAGNIAFETSVGKDFERDAKKIVYASAKEKPKQTYIEERYVVSEKKRKFRNMLLLPLYLTLVLVVTVIGIIGYKEYRSRKQLEELQSSVHIVTEQPSVIPSEIQEAEPEIAEDSHIEEEQAREVLPQFKELAERNADFAGWLAIPGTKIDYPVMYRADDNDFYLSHGFEGEDDKNGLLVLDKRCSPDGSGTNNLIHGHNMKSGAIFGSLDNYLDQRYYREHPYILFSTLYEERTYEVFAVFRSSVYDENTTDFQYFNYIQIENEEQFNSYVENAKEQSVYDTGIGAAYGDNLITLSTCEYSKQNGRLVIVGRQIE